MKRIAFIEIGRNGGYSICSEDLQCAVIIGEGDTLEEAKADFELSVQELIQCYVEDGKEVPKELQKAKFTFKYYIASLFEYYPINASKFAQLAGINPAVMRKYKKGALVTEKQMPKIQKAINQLGSQLATLQWV